MFQKECKAIFVAVVLHFIAVVELSKVGPYFAYIKAMKSHEIYQPELADYFFYLQQVNMTNRVVQGYISIEEDIGPLFAIFSFESWTDSGFIQQSGSQISYPICQRKMPSYSFLLYFSPKDGFDAKNCILKKGKYTMEPMDYNEMLHEHFETNTYGRKLYHTDYVAQGKDGVYKPVFGHSMDIKIVDLLFHKITNNRAED